MNAAKQTGIASGAGLVLLACSVLFPRAAHGGSDPWMEKPFEQWTMSEVQKVLADSPWTRIITVTRMWTKISAEDVPAGALGGGRRGLPSGEEQTADGMLGKDVDFLVFWMSSRVMREATARRAVLESRMTEAEAEKYANEPQQEYEIVIQGKDMSPFELRDEQFFRDKAFLKTRKTKQSVSPVHIRFERGSNGKSVNAAIFFFARQNAAGVPLIAPDENSVEFSCRLEGVTLKASFVPARMVDQKGPAL